MKLGDCSPTAFFHEQGIYDKEKNIIVVDLSRKLIIFLDQPQNKLLVRLRSLLSHDEREMQSKITDKNEKGGNKTKTVIIKGYPAVIFCSAGLAIDEQESTRFILLSPEMNQEKIRESISERVKKSADSTNYNELVENDFERTQLKERIIAIRNERINEIKIIDTETILNSFFSKRPQLRPRHQRDIGRLISLIKAFALLNLWQRQREINTIIANENDINDGIAVWESIAESQEYHLPPYILNLYKDVIISAWEAKKLVSGAELGLTRKDIATKHFAISGRPLADWLLRQQILPMLEAAGLIIQEPDVNDKRVIRILPVTATPIQNNSEKDSGVNVEDVLNK
jgi:hypothetical protein